MGGGDFHIPVKGRGRLLTYLNTRKVVNDKSEHDPPFTLSAFD